jgi:hypothetical protein
LGILTPTRAVIGGDDYQIVQVEAPDVSLMAARCCTDEAHSSTHSSRNRDALN